MNHLFSLKSICLALSFVSFSIFAKEASACTSVIISGKFTSDGRPLMLKHRDTDFLDNAIVRGKGPLYTYIGLCNAGNEKEIWSGTNSAGFCIMNTATYDLKDDDIPDSLMDREGLLMARALGICRDLSDFEMLLDTLSRPMGVEANFGIIDAFGGAAYYEVNNHSWTKFDVNEIPCGWRVVTNFTETGRRESRHGVDRYEKAVSIMKNSDISKLVPLDLINSISRSGLPICREISSAAIVFQGVARGGRPGETVMWTCLGWPEATVCVPLLEAQTIPSWMSPHGKEGHAAICDEALYIKKAASPDGVSDLCRKVETVYSDDFSSQLSSWSRGETSLSAFSDKYKSLLSLIRKTYLDYFRDYLRK